MLLNNHSQRLPGPDIVRAIAITLVVLAHTSGMWRTGAVPVTAQHFMQQLWPAAAGTATHDATILLPKGRTWVPAALGVELFFVLSGYLIGTLLIKDIANNGHFSLAQLKQFLARRWMRTLPAYWLVVTILIPIWLIVLKKNLTWKVLLYYVFLQNMATPHPGFFSVAWSLSVEEWFYLTLPLCVLIAGRNITTLNSGRWLLRCLLAYMMGAICLRIGNASLLPYGTDFDNGIRKMVITRLDAPLYGVIIAWYLYYKPQLLHFKSYLLSISLIATMLLAALMYYLEPGGPHMHHWLYLSFNTVLVHTLLPMALALCLPAAVAYSNSGKSLWQKAASYVARISYSVYLTHYYLFYLLPFSRVHFVSVPAQMMFYSLYLLVVCLVSSLLYYVVEKPMLRLRDYLFPTVGSSTNAVAA